MTVWSTDQLDAVLKKGHVRVHSIANARMVKPLDKPPLKKLEIPVFGPPRKKGRNSLEKLEERLGLALENAGIVHEKQYAWCPGRKFRADYAVPEKRLLIELDGAVHRIKGRFKADQEKRQLAILHGWTMLPIATDQVRKGTAVELIKRVLAG